MAGKSLSKLLAAFTCLALSAGAVYAQKPTIAEIANLSDPDRAQRIVEGAKQEGTITIYSTAPVADISAITAAFEQKYGIKVQLWRGSTQDVLQRVLTENRAGRYEVDTYETSGLTLEALHREKLLQPVKSPVLQDIIPVALTSHGDWTAIRLNIYTAAYNTNLIKNADLPKSYGDLLDPKWRGKLAVDTESYDWFATLAEAMGEQKGIKLFRDIISTNGMSIRKGHTLLANLVAAGEVPLALTAYEYRAIQLKKQGAPVDYFHLSPLIALPVGISVSAKPPHPFGALLFYEFMLTDAQKILVQNEYFPTNRKVQEPPADLNLKLVDFHAVLDENDKWNKLFQEIFANQSR